MSPQLKEVSEAVTWPSEGRATEIECKFWRWESVCCALGPARDGMLGEERAGKEGEMRSESIRDRRWGRLGAGRLWGVGKPLEGSDLWSDMI